MFTPYDLPAFICGSCSLVACAWALSHLLVMPLAMRMRLFWRQMVLLTILDIMMGLFTLLFALLDTNYGKAHSRLLASVWPVLLGACFVLETAICLGLVAACRDNAQAGRRLHCATLPVMMLFSLLSGVLFYVLPDNNAKWFMAGVGLLVFFSFVVSAYVYCAVLARRFPSGTRHRPLAQAVSYTVSSLCTAVPLAIVFFADPPSKAEDLLFSTTGAWQAVHIIISVDGLLHVCAYMFWLWRSARAERRLAKAQHGDDVEALQNMLLVTYFDLRIDEDDAGFKARRLVTSAVADALDQYCSECSST